MFCHASAVGVESSLLSAIAPLNQVVNFSFNFATLLGLFDLLLALGSLALSITLIAKTKRLLEAAGTVIYAVQAVLATLILLTSGAILIWNGWRLDPILLFAVFLQHLLIIYLGLKDILIFQLLARRSQR